MSSLAHSPERSFGGAFVLALLASATLLAPGVVFAQSDEPTTEEPDPTRLDVERLPPEAIEITRELYSHGFMVEGWVGARGFVGGVGRLSTIGPYFNVGFGLEIFDFLMVRLAFEGSPHETRGPAPPSPTAFELLGAVAELRLQLNLGAFWGIWVQGEFGATIAFGDVLRVLGLDQSNSVGLMYGGSLGLDWHMKNRHTSIGLLGGARLYPSLAGIDDEQAIGIHGAAYLRYVF